MPSQCWKQAARLSEGLLIRLILSQDGIALSLGCFGQLYGLGSLAL